MKFQSQALIALLLFGVFVTISQSVDESLFKKCAQSSFCKRIRAQQAGNSKFHFDPASLKFDSYSVTGEIDNSEYDRQFTFLLQPLAGETFRFQIEEKNSLLYRYRVEDALQSEPKLGIFTQGKKNVANFEIYSGINRVVITFQPFKMEFYNADMLTVTVNGKDLMSFEYLRKKPQPVPENEKDLWEESFTSSEGSWTDIKRMGPEAVGLDFTFNVAQVLFGIPEHADSFSLRTTTGGSSDPYRLFNSDVPFHDTSSTMALYGSVPVIYGHGVDRTAGVYWQNAAETWVDIYPDPSNSSNAQAARFFSESGIIDVFIILGAAPNLVFKRYTDLTGVAPMPQLYSLGYHQCRWNYDNQSDLLGVNDGFNIHEIPMDTLWLDIEYTYKKWYFTWDPVTFPDPLKMIQNLADDGRHLNVIVDIHIAATTDYHVYNELVEKDLCVKDKDRELYIGACWPGPSVYPDVFMKEARDYLAAQYQLVNFPKTTDTVMIWNDMNEPSAFSSPEKTFPRDNIHYGGWEHRDVHNIFGHMQVMSTFDGLMQRGKGSKRPFILTRAHFAGSQRYAAVWTGDNTASWEFLRASIKMCLSQAVSGISFCGADVGGFFNDPDNELFERWYQAAAFQPFYRSHANDQAPRREPWLRGEETMGVIRTAIKKRYTYLPFWYTLFYEHEMTGLPIMRPLLSHYPKDQGGFKIDNEYLLSDILLVRPVDESGVTEVDVYFPSLNNLGGDLWYDIDDYTLQNETGNVKIEVDRNKIPVYQRGGTILPKKETEQKSSHYMKDDPYTLIVCLDRDERATGTLYTDDETSYEYRNGKYIYQTIQFANNILTKVYSQTHENYDSKSNLTTVVVAGLKQLPKRVILKYMSQEKDLHFDSEGHTIFVHEINVPIQSQWSVTLSENAGYLVKSSLMLCLSVVLFFVVY